MSWWRTEIARAPRLFGAVLVMAVAAATYANTLDGGFHFDDGHHITENPYVRDAAFLDDFWTRPDLFSALPGHHMYRPVVMAAHTLNYRWGGYDPLAWRLTAIALHVIATLGVFLAIAAVSDRLKSHRPLTGATVAALIFAAHPVLTESVNYASARSSLLATVGVVWALTLHFAAEKRRRPWARLSLWALSLSSFAFALFSKEIACMYPVLLLWCCLRTRSRLVPVLPTFLVLGLYLFTRDLLLGSAVVDFQARAAGVAQADPSTGAGRPVLWNLFTQARVILHYLWLVVWPSDLSVNRHVRVSSSAWDLDVIACGLTIIGLWVVAWRERVRFPRLSMGIVWFFMALAPTSSIVPLNQVMNEHRMYLPMVGIMLALAAGVSVVWRGRWRGWRMAVPIGAVVVALVVVSHRRNRDWSTSEALWTAAVRVSPESGACWNALGTQQRLAGKYDRALASFQRSRKLDERAWAPRFNLGTLYLQRGHETKNEDDFVQAERWLHESLEVEPDSERSRWYLAETWNQMGRVAEAEAEWRALAGRNERLRVMTRFPLAGLLAERGDFAQAEALYREALESPRDPVSAYLGLAELADRQKQPEQALQWAREALRVRPHSPSPYVYLAHRHAGQPSAVRYLFEAERRGYRPTPRERSKILARSRP